MSGINFFRVRGLLGLMLLSALISSVWFGFRPPGGYKLADFDPRRVKENITAYSSDGSPGIFASALNTPVITSDTVVVREYHFNWCGHTEAGKAAKDRLLAGLTSEQLKRLYPASEGWEVNFDRPNHLVLRLNLEELCAMDLRKRHLGEIDGKVAIYIGPSGFQGSLEKLTQIPLKSLPPEWREGVSQGTIEFSDSEALSQALDSLDEYY